MLIKSESEHKIKINLGLEAIKFKVNESKIMAISGKVVQKVT
jgi:hypothetical protein